MYRQFFPAVQQYSQRYFFDNAATTQYCEAAIDATRMLDSLPRANVARGIYQEAEKVSELYEEARCTIAHILGMKEHEVIFCRGTTDALNISAHCLMANLKKDQAVLVSNAEHHSNFLPWLELCKQNNHPFYRLPVTPQGVIDIDQLEQFDDKNIAVVAVTHCSNVTGVVSDIPRISAWCKRNNATLVVDGAQMVQHHLPDISSLGADVYCFSGHKAFASSGIGVLCAKEQLLEQWQPHFWGGGMMLNIPEIYHPEPDNGIQQSARWLDTPQKFEAGTPSYQQAVILAQVLKWFSQLEQKPLEQYHRDLFNKADAILKKYDFIHYIDNPHYLRQPIFAFNFKSLHPHDAAQLFDSLGFCVRAGHHCAKPLLHSLQLDACLRISLSCYNTLEELELFEKALQTIQQQASHLLNPH